MLSRQGVIVTLAAVVALALALIEFEVALSGAGPYKAMRQVQLGAFVGISLGYFFALWLAAYSARRACALDWPALRKVTLVGIALIAAGAVLVSPLLAALILAAGCKTELLCPNVANPVLWSYLNAVTQLPLPPFVAGVGAVIAIALASRPRRFHKNDG
jgi:hypothetical protein